MLCTPIIRAIKEQLKAEVHFLSKASYTSILSPNPNIDEVIAFKDDLHEVKEILQSHDYDYIIDLHNNLRSKRVKKWLNKPSGKFPKLNIQKWLLVNAKIDRLPCIHIVDRYFEAVKNLGKISNDNKGLDYFIPKDEVIDLSLYNYGILNEKPFVALVLGATYFTKRIPKTKAVEVIKGLDQTVVLIGGPEEANLGSQIAEQCDNVINTCGTLTLNQSASFIKQSTVVITGDTGMMHIAAAFKKPIAMIWGNTVPAFGMGPYLTETHHFEVENLKCRPCSKLGHHQCPKGHFKCMEEQDVKGIIEVCSVAGAEGE